MTASQQTLEFHEVANLFPFMSSDEYASLVDDIDHNGQLEPIWIYEGKIIDGRNRYKACCDLGIDPIIREWHGTGSLVSFVVSLNLKRRHLTSGQKAVLALEIEKHLAVEAKDRQGKRNDLLGNFPQNFAESCQEKESRQQAADIVGTNRQYVSDAKKIQRDAPEVLDYVRSGELNIGEAKILAALPQEDRGGAIESVLSGATTVKNLTAANHASDSDGDEWYTPIEWIDAARILYGGTIDTDPASCAKAQSKVNAAMFYTKDDNGLELDWNGNVWCNPPYSTALIKQFTQRAHDQYVAGKATSVLLLVNNCTDTKWFSFLAERYPVVFSYGRADFWRPGQETFATRQGQALFYLGKDMQGFYKAFSHLAYAPNRGFYDD